MKARAASAARSLVELGIVTALFAPSLTVQLPSVARADGVADEADLHFQRGIAAYRESAWLEALEHFLASNRLSPNRNVTYNIARCYERLGRPAEAYRYYSEAVQSEPDATVRAQVEASLRSLAPQLALVEVISDPPGATIYIDRVDLGSVGTTPRVLALQAGEHRVLLRMEGHEDLDAAPTTLSTGQLQRVEATLQRIVGTLEVEGQPDAEVRVGAEDGAPACNVPCELELPPGPHVVHVVAPGMRPVTQQVTVVARGRVRLAPTLQPRTGSLLVTTDEPGVRVEVDDATRGFTPAVVSDLPVGSHRVRLSARGREALETQVTITEGQQAELRDQHLEAREVVEAASRRTERIESAPGSVTVIPREELEAFAFPTLDSALQGVRGFAMSFDSVYASASVRGLGQPNDYSNRLVVLQDGARLNENILTQPFLRFDGRSDLADIERIEIVRGAGSVLHGSGAVSGIINLVPRGQDERTHADFQLSGVASRVGRARAAMHLLLGPQTYLRMAVSAASGAGDSVTLGELPSRGGASIAVDGVERFDAFTVNGRLQHEALTLQWFYHARQTAVPTGWFGSRTRAGIDVPTVDHRGLLELRFEPRLSDTLQVLTRAHVNYTRYDATLLFDVGDTVQRYREDFDGFWVGAEARAIWRIVPELDATLGGEAVVHPVVELDGQQWESGPDQPATVVLASRPTYGVYSAYGMLDWTPIESFRISAGARFDAWDIDQRAGTSLGPDLFSVSPRLALVLQASRVDTLKLTGGRAFRAPSPYELAYFDGGSTQLESTCCGSALGPEQTTQAEFEYTHRFDSEWSALGSLHVQVGEGQVESRAVPEAILVARGLSPEAMLTYYANSTDDVLVLGADAVVRRAFRSGWMFDAQIGVQDARYMTPFGLDRVPNVPNVTGSIRGIVPILSPYLRIATRVSIESPRRFQLGAIDETAWAAIADVVFSGSVAETGLTYSVGVMNLFDWRVALPVSPFAAPSMTQAGRTFQLSLSLSL